MCGPAQTIVLDFLRFPISAQVAPWLRGEAHGIRRQQRRKTQEWSPAFLPTGMVRNGRMRSIASRGYGKGQKSTSVMTDETRKRLFPEDGLVTELGTQGSRGRRGPRQSQRRHVGYRHDGPQRDLARRARCFCLPGLGIAAAGPVAAAVAGAATAGIAGGLIGALHHWGIPRIAPGRIRTRDQAWGGILPGVKPHSDADAGYFEEQWKVDQAESCPRVAARHAGDGGRPRRCRFVRIAALMLLCPEDLEPCSRPGCRAGGCEAHRRGAAFRVLAMRRRHVHAVDDIRLRRVRARGRPGNRKGT